ncbi:MAG: hypothetical protein AAF368_13420, partial [Planctomycetota bacterium]
MALQPRLHQRQSQGLLLQPKMLQSIEVLQLGNLELENWIAEASERNEALVVEAPASSSGSSGGGDADREAWLRAQPAPELGLSEKLEEQLALSGIEDPDR